MTDEVLDLLYRDQALTIDSVDTSITPYAIAFVLDKRHKDGETEFLVQWAEPYRPNQWVHEDELPLSVIQTHDKE